MNLFFNKRTKLLKLKRRRRKREGRGSGRRKSGEGRKHRGSHLRSRAALG